MANNQRKATLSLVHRIGLEDSSPYCIVTINTNLVTVTFAVVDWITPHVLKFIAHKDEELIN